MPPLPPHPPAASDQRARDVFAAYLADLDSGRATPFEHVLAANEDLRERLLALHRRRQALLADGFFVENGGGEDVTPEERTESAGLRRLRRVLERLETPVAWRHRYRVRGELGMGGMGRVLHVYDRHLRRDLAMKVLGQPGAGVQGDPEFDVGRVGRLLDEASITAQLDHPAVPPIHDVGLTPEGEVFFTMKLISSRRTLEDVIAELHGEASPWTLPGVLALALRACEAVDYAHRLGVIHRDLKPANVLVGQAGEVYVTDWGLARVLDQHRDRDLVPRRHDLRPARVIHSLRHGPSSSASETQSGSGIHTREGRVVGTPGYMSPEQADGRPEALSPRSDVYSMGVLLREVVSGTPEQSGSSQRSAPELDAILATATAPEAAKRYADMGELARDLAAFLEGRVVRAHRTGALVELRKWVQRNRGLAAALALAILALGGGLWTSLRLLGFNRVMLAREVKGKGLANLRLAEGLLEVGGAGAEESLLETAPPERGWEWKHLLARTDSSLQAIEGGTSVRAAFFEPDSDSILTVSEAGSWRRRFPGREEQGPLVRCEPPDAIRCAARSLDGAWVGARGERYVHVWSTETGELLEGFPVPVAPLSTDLKSTSFLSFAPDGSRVAFVSGTDRVAVHSLFPNETREHHEPGTRLLSVAWIDDSRLVTGARWKRAGRVSVWDVEANTVRAQWDVPGGDGIMALAVDPDGAHIATASENGTVRIFTIDGTPQLVLPGHREQVFDLEYAPGGSVLASVGLDRSLRLWNVEDGRILTTLTGHRERIYSVAFEASGTRIVTASRDGSVRLWERGQESGITGLAAHYGMRSVAFSPDSTRVAAGTDSFVVQVWDARLASPQLSLFGHRDRINDLEWTPDGKRILSASADGTLRLWDLEQGVALRVFEEHESDVSSVALAPDGRRAVSASWDGSVRMHDLEGESERALLWRGERALDSVLWTADGRWILAGGGAGELIRIRAARPEDVRVLPVHASGITRMALDPVQNRLAIGCVSGAIVLLDLVSEREERRMEQGFLVLGLGFTPDGKSLIAASDDRSLAFWDPESGTQRISLALPELPTDLACAGDGTRLALTGRDALLRLFETQRARDLQPARVLQRRLEGRVAAHVDQAFAQHLTLGEVLRALDQSDELTEEERQAARRLARWHNDDPASLAQVALDLVAQRGDPASYERARRAAARASELQGIQRWAWILGAAHARLGQHERALELLPSCGNEELHNQRRLGYVTLSLRVYSLMAGGHREEAEECLPVLERIREAGGPWSSAPSIAELRRDVALWMEQER